MHVSGGNAHVAIAAGNDSRCAVDEELGVNIGACSLDFVLVAQSARGVCAIPLGNKTPPIGAGSA